MHLIEGYGTFARVSRTLHLLREGPQALPPSPSSSSLPGWKIHGVYLSPGQQTFIAISGSPDPSKISASHTAEMSSDAGERKGCVCVWGVISHPLHTAKVKEIPLPEREGQTGEEFKGSKAQFHLCWLQNTQTKVPNLFQKGGGGRNLAAVVPLALAAMFPWK